MTGADITADAVNIVLIVVIIASYVIGMVALRRAIGGEGIIGGWNFWTSLFVGFLLAGYLVIHVLAHLNMLAGIGALTKLNEISPSEWAQILLVLGLVVATGFYALMTFRMAKEMREQRLSEARPYVLLKLVDEYLLWYDQGDKTAPRQFMVKVNNAGKGPAINLNAGLWRHDDTFAMDTKGYLAPGQEWGATINRSSTDGIALGEKVPYPQLKDKVKEKTVVVVEYEDIHHLKWISYLSFEDMDDTGYIRDGELNIMELKDSD